MRQKGYEILLLLIKEKLNDINMVFQFMLHEIKDHLGLVIGYKYHKPTGNEVSTWLKGIHASYWVISLRDHP